MRKLIMALVLALITVVSLSMPALAWGDEDTEVTLSDITVTPFDSSGIFPVEAVNNEGVTIINNAPNCYLVGTTLNVSGQVDITSKSEVKGFLTLAYAESEGWYIVSDPDGVIVSDGSSSRCDLDAGFKKANADAGQTYTWSCNLTLTNTGYWTVQQGGDALAWYLALFGGAGASTDTDAELITITSTAGW